MKDKQGRRVLSPIYMFELSKVQKFASLKEVIHWLDNRYGVNQWVAPSYQPDDKGEMVLIEFTSESLKEVEQNELELARLILEALVQED